MASVNPEIAGGGVFYKLLHRAYPGFYKGDSVYAMYPLQTPGKMREVLASLGREMDFSYTPPSRLPESRVVNSLKAVTDVLNHPVRFIDPGR